MSGVLEKKVLRKEDAFDELGRKRRNPKSIKKFYDRINSRISNAFLGE
jgi:hypothetical protein